MVNEKDPEIKRKLKAFTDAFKEARLVGCVRGSMILGEAQCPLIALCEFAPKKDSQEQIQNAIARVSQIEASQISRESSTEFIENAWKLLEEAKEITARCPLRINLNISKIPKSMGEMRALIEKGNKDFDRAWELLGKIISGDPDS